MVYVYAFSFCTLSSSTPTNNINLSLIYRWAASTGASTTQFTSIFISVAPSCSKAIVTNNYFVASNFEVQLWKLLCNSIFINFQVPQELNQYVFVHPWHRNFHFPNFLGICVFGIEQGHTKRENHGMPHAKHTPHSHQKYCNSSQAYAHEDVLDGEMEIKVVSAN